MRTSFVLVLSLLLLSAGCGDDVATGNDKTLDFKEGDVTTTVVATTAPPTTPAPATTVKGSATTAATTPKTTKAVATTTKASSSFAITIRPDGDPKGQIDPKAASVKVGTAITWTNTDSAPRSVVATNNAFSSGDIAPGATYSWTASTAGTIKYKDGTRPYALGELTVT